MMTDPIADMLTRIRNAGMARHKNVTVAHSKQKERILDVLKTNGYIDGFQAVEYGSKRDIKVQLRYDEATREPVIAGIERVSKPGRRVYASADEAPKVLSGLGISILSTSLGLLTDREARAKNVGGEVLLKVW